MKISTATLFLTAMLTATVAAAQSPNSYLVFSPLNIRTSPNTTLTPFGTSTLQLSCPTTTPVTAILSSSKTPTSTSPSTTYANVFTDNFIGLSVNGSQQVDVCQGGYSADGVEGGTDCFSTTYPSVYQSYTGDDPDIYVGNIGVPAPNISSNLSNLTGTIQAQFQLMDSGVSLGNSSVYLITNCTQMGVAPGGSLPGNQITPTSTSQLDQTFPFDSTTGQRVEFEASYTAASAAGTLNQNSLNDSPIPTINNNGIEPGNWPAVVAGTSFATTSCIPDLGLLDASNNPLCALSTILCTNSVSSTPAGDNCLQSTAKNIQMFHTFDASPSSVTGFPPGTGLGFLMGSDNWPSSSCTFIGPETGVMCPQNPITSFLGDFRSGSGGGTTNSTFVSVSGVPLPFTLAGFLPYSFGWSNSSTVTLGFLTIPPIVPPPNNNFIAAPINTLTYGIDNLPPNGDTSLPITGDFTLSNSVACPSAPTAGSAKPLVESATVTNLADGAHQLHYFATDCAGTEELVFTPNLGNTGNWATFKTLTINVDTTPPYVSSVPTLGTYVLNQVVKASYSCADAPPVGSTATPSGVVLCGPTLASLVHPTSNTGTLTSPVNTSTTGTHTFTVMVRDLAGNVGKSMSVTYTVVK